MPTVTKRRRKIQQKNNMVPPLRLPSVESSTEQEDGSNESDDVYIEGSDSEDSEDVYIEDSGNEGSGEEIGREGSDAKVQGEQLAC